jgi:hypothetical protein
MAVSHPDRETAMRYVTEVSLFGAAFIAAYAYGNSLVKALGVAKLGESVRAWWNRTIG